MTDKGGDDGATSLRRLAEQLLLAQGGGAASAGAAASLADVQRLVHELQVHQVELEMQNDELRRAQADLGAARARYFDLYDLAPMGYLSLDAQGLIVEANLLAAELLGLPRGALVGQPLERFIAKSEQDHYYLQRRRPHPAGKEQASELMMRKSDGSYFWGRLVEGPAQAEAGAARRVVLTDISGRKRNEADRERLLAAVEQSDEAIIITDTAGAIQYVNPAFTRVTGYARAEALGQNPRLLKSGAQGAAFYRDLWSTLTAGQAWKGRFDNQRKDGGRYIQECSITPVLDGDENIVNYVAVARDITQRLAEEAANLPPG
jgi:PAS domain S-box-containing protein